MNEQPTGRFFRGVTLLITNAFKLVGLAIVLKEVFAPSLTDPARAEILAIAAFMMAGAQFSETLIMGVMDRLMLRPDEEFKKVEKPK